MRTANPLLDALFAAAPVGLAFWDRELRYQRVNETLAAINGVPVDDHIGRTVEEVLPEVGPEVARLLRGVLESGEAVVELEVSGETPAEPGVHRTWQASYYPVYDGEGEPMGVGAVVSEITERKLAEAELEVALSRTELLAATSRLLEATLDYESTLENVLRLLVPDRADLAIVELVQPDGEVARVAVAAADPEREVLVRELEARFPVDPNASIGPGAVIRGGEPLLLTSVPDELLERSASGPEHLDLLRRLAFESVIVVPLRARGTTYGALLLVMSESGRRYGADDVELAQELADRFAMAVDNARLYAERSFVARTLQQAMLPARLPDIAGLDVAVQYRAAAGATDVGGDFYDVHDTPRGWQFMVGDVAGKGPLAAASTGLVRHTLRALARYEDSPAAVLRAANAALLEQLPPDDFCTVALVEVDVVAMRARIALAGHPLPMLARPGEPVREVGEPGQLLGAVEDPEIYDAELELRSGDLLLLYTDGVIEARDDHGQLGPERLSALIEMLGGNPPAELTGRLLRAISAFEGIQRDDIALVALRVTPDRRRVPR